MKIITLTIILLLTSCAGTHNPAPNTTTVTVTYRGGGERYSVTNAKEIIITTPADVAITINGVRYDSHQKAR